MKTMLVFFAPLLSIFTPFALLLSIFTPNVPVLKYRTYTPQTNATKIASITSSGSVPVASGDLIIAAVTSATATIPSSFTLSSTVALTGSVCSTPQTNSSGSAPNTAISICCAVASASSSAATFTSTPNITAGFQSGNFLVYSNPTSTACPSMSTVQPFNVTSASASGTFSTSGRAVIFGCTDPLPAGLLGTFAGGRVQVAQSSSGIGNGGAAGCITALLPYAVSGATATSQTASGSGPGLLLSVPY